MRIRWLPAVRGVVVVAVLASSAVHLYVYAAGFAGIPVIGPLFLSNVVGGVVIAAAVGLWRHWLPALLAVGFGLTTVAAYWISVVHGLFGVREVADGWPEIVAQVAEYAAVVFGALATAVLWRQREALRTGTTARHRERGSTGAPTPEDWTAPSPRGQGETIRQTLPTGRADQ